MAEFESTSLARFEADVAPLLPAILGFLLRRVGNTEAEDLLQETTIQAWQKWHQLREREKIRGWLFQIALNLLQEHQRRSARRERLVPVVDVDEQFLDRIAAAEANSLEQLISRATDAGVWNALQALPRELALALELFEIDELSYREVAAVLEIPLGTVMSRIHRARKQLAVTLLACDVLEPARAKVEHGGR